MPLTPPASLVTLLHDVIFDLLTDNPIATSSEAYVQNHVEFELIKAPEDPPNPRYYLRIGINYHGDKVQHIGLDDGGRLLGWNESGEALGTKSSAKMLLSGYTIFDRDRGEQIMTDTKIGGGEIPRGAYIRIEFKVRGWLGKTRNLDGAQFEKDLDLMKMDRADLLIWCLSETAHLKFQGEGPAHHAARRTGTSRFAQILVPTTRLSGTNILQRDIVFEGQDWTVSSRRTVASFTSIMPGAEHFITMCWRRMPAMAQGTPPDTSSASHTGGATTNVAQDLLEDSLEEDGLG